LLADNLLVLFLRFKIDTFFFMSSRTVSELDSTLLSLHFVELLLNSHKLCFDLENVHPFFLSFICLDYFNFDSPIKNTSFLIFPFDFFKCFPASTQENYPKISHFLWTKLALAESLVGVFRDVAEMAFLCENWRSSSCFSSRHTAFWSRCSERCDLFCIFVLNLTYY
jgi:hypothetical protein